MIDLVAESEYNAGNPEHPLVIAYYTVDTPYQHEAESLKLSLESLGYNYFIGGVPNLGNWQRNTQYKALFIQSVLQKFVSIPLLYLDVDAIMVQPPVLLDTIKADIAAVHFRGKNELLSGTLYLGSTRKCHKVVQRWIRINERHPTKLPNGKHAWDQRTLAMAIKQIQGIKFVELPQEYTFIIELTQRYYPGLNPVIMHTRGAKRFKNIINGKKGYAQ